MRVFLDAHCLYSALRSPSGASGRVLELAQCGFVTIAFTEQVLNEVSRNVHKKEGAEASRRLSLTLALCDREIVENPSSEEEEPWREITVEKDLHVLAGAMKANAHYLISLDKKHIVNAQVKNSFPIPIVTPGEFITAMDLHNVP